MADFMLSFPSIISRMPNPPEEAGTIFSHFTERQAAQHGFGFKVTRLGRTRGRHLGPTLSDPSTLDH